MEREVISFRSAHLICMMAALLPVSSAYAEECRFDYWQVIPASTNCEVFKLPDFEFKRLPKDTSRSDPLSKFCSNFAIRSKAGVQERGYCYTGEGDRSGPLFEVGGTKYLADLAFQGCVNGKAVHGIVFAKGGWSKPPSYIKRLWPVSELPNKPSC
ncbi:MAG: hypothetical protein J5J00_14300 [Deltaproteobacteria bacterium]|nr:hypothetical protein [Deltaproteobacteria bacterium]